MDIIQSINRKIQEIKIARTGVFKPGTEEKNKALEKARKEGTTILALKHNGGIIMAADRRCVVGERIFTDEMIKIEEISSHSCIAGAGWVSDFQILTEILKDSLIPEFKKYWETEIFVDGQANLLKYIMRNILLLTWPILAGWDPYEKRGRIFLADPGGTFLESFGMNDFLASGSGETHALGILKEKWSKNCTATEGIRIAIEALLAASSGDRNTSDPRLTSPIIKIISSSGIYTLPSEKIFRIAWGKTIKEQARKGVKDGIGAFIIRDFLKKLEKELGKEMKEGEKENDNTKPGTARI